MIEIKFYVEMNDMKKQQYLLYLRLESYEYIKKIFIKQWKNV
ncbi:unnamed protein product [Paramecium sonneborni]|uniref:Uncharacterized protein n=1 Tax=Paramecium sonneborni TaxID=65129 RepID=A0A8S1P0Q9_9CILI|nr:unnamed protein product [Paramecium sonneborni]